MSYRLPIFILSALAAVALIGAGLAINGRTSNLSPTGSVSDGNKVTIQNYTFVPARITVKVGSVVTWTNHDDVHHTVSVDTGSGPQSTLLGQNDTYQYRFDKTGTYTYHCEPHTSMHGTVIVFK